MDRFQDRLRDTARRLERFGREFTAGMSRRELERLFDEDAARAVTALAGQRPKAKDDEDELRRFAAMVRGFFLGLALKLSPARRLLFVTALLLTVFGLFDWNVRPGPVSFTLDFSPLWMLLAVAALTLLLALELVDRLRVRDELEVARALQHELLPQATPELPFTRIAHSYRTANEIGGDYYDFLPLPDGRWAFAVGDASGHGIGAGLLMAIASASLKTALDLDPSPPAVLALLDRVLARTGGRRAFMTLFYGVLEPAGGRFEYANAGHPFPLLRRADGRVEELGAGSLPLGLGRGGGFPGGEQTLAPGDLLVLYSDGIPEAMGAGGEDFGFERLRKLLTTTDTPQRIHDRILAALDRHLGEQPLTDDVTLVVVDRLPPLPES